MVLMALLVVTSSVVTLILIHNHQSLVASLVSMVLKLMVSSLLMTLNLVAPLNLVVPFVMVVASVAVVSLMILSSMLPLVQTD